MEKLKDRSTIDNKFKWDLTKLFNNVDEFQKSYDEINFLVKKVASYKGKIMLNSDNLYSFYQDYEKLNRFLDKHLMYAYLSYDSDTTNEEYKMLKLKIDKLCENINDELSFISSEIVSIPYEKVEEYLKENDKLKFYEFDLKQLFKYKDHTLNEKEEEIITKACNAMGTSSEVFNCLDNTDVSFNDFVVDGKTYELNNANYISYLNSRNREIRKKAFENLYEYYKNHINTLATCFRGNIKEDYFISNVRKFDNPLEQSLYADDIKKEVYTNLIRTVHDNLNKVYDYFDLRKKILKLDELHMYDIHVDLIEEESKNVPFEEGKEIIFEALKPLGQNYLEDLKKAFLENWIDIYPNKGKKSGAYSWGCYDSYPYLLLNYHNDIDSVSTMIHELGHSMHSYYTNKNQEYTYSGHSIFLAEIASTVNEVLLNHYLYEHAETKEEKILYLTEFLDKVRTTIVRQTMFAEFEMIVYEKEQNNIPLTVEELNNTYYELNKLYFGNNVISDDDIKYEWSRIPHFYSSFYVYKYATGLSAAISIVSDILKTNDASKYLEFLASGTSDYPLEILKRTGVDMTTTEPIEKAFEMFEEKLNKLKELI